MPGTIFGTEGANQMVRSGSVPFDKAYGLGGDDLIDFTGAWGSSPFYLYGGAGNDTIRGSTRTTSYMDGGAGNDGYVVNSSLNIVTEGANAGYDTLYIATPYVDAGGSRSIVMAGSGVSGGYTVDADVESVQMNIWTGKVGPNNVGFTFHGNDYANNFGGSEGADTIRGRGGNDTLNGKGGADRMDGGVGLDILNGGDGSDLMFGGKADGDKLTGGAGADIFVLSGKGGSPITLTDVIMDHNSSLDTIVLQGIGSKITSVSTAYVGGKTEVAIGGSLDTAVFTMQGSYSNSAIATLVNSGKIGTDDSIFV